MNALYFSMGSGFRKPETTFSSTSRSKQRQPNFVKNTMFLMHGLGRKRSNRFTNTNQINQGTVKRASHSAQPYMYGLNRIQKRIQKRSVHTKRGTSGHSVKKRAAFQKRGDQLDTLRFMLKRHGGKAFFPRFHRRARYQNF